MSHNPTVLTREALAEIRARADAATEGPWMALVYRKPSAGDEGMYDVRAQPHPAMRGFTKLVADAHEGKADAEFIAHAREDIPRLLDALESLLEPTEAMVEVALDAWYPDGDWRSFQDETDKRDMRAALKAALALAKPQEHNASEGNG